MGSLYRRYLLLMLWRSSYFIFFVAKQTAKNKKKATFIQSLINLIAENSNKRIQRREFKEENSKKRIQRRVITENYFFIH